MAGPDNNIIGTVKETSILAADVDPVDEVLDSLLDLSLEALGAESGSIFLSEGDTLVLSAARGPDASVIQGARRKTGEGIAGRVAAEGEPLLVEDMRADGRFASRISPRYTHHSFISVPLMNAGDVLGVINITSKRSGQSFDSTDQKLLSTLACMASSAIETARACEDLVEKLRATTRDHKRNVAKLTYLKDHNRSVVESISSGVAVFNPQMGVTFCNRAFCDLAGRQRDDILGKDLLEVYPHDDGALREKCRATLNDGITRRVDAAVCEIAGNTEKILNVSVAPFISGGRITGGVLTLDDVTQEKHLEQQLANSLKEAEIGKLAARVAHELNNPLDGILRYINLTLARLPKGDTLWEYQDEARTALLRMAEIIRVLLAYSRKSGGTNGRPIDVKRLLHDAVRCVCHMMPEHNVDVVFDMEGEVWVRQSSRVYQVFVNTIKNAFDAMKQTGGGTLTINGTSENGTVTVRIGDTGCGIPPEFTDKVFDPFFTSKELCSGTGLGLAISKRVIEECGGSLTFESEVGKGTTFSITLPVEGGVLNDRVTEQHNQAQTEG